MSKVGGCPHSYDMREGRPVQLRDRGGDWKDISMMRQPTKWWYTYSVILKCKEGIGKRSPPSSGLWRNRYRNTNLTRIEVHDINFVGNKECSVLNYDNCKVSSLIPITMKIAWSRGFWLFENITLLTPWVINIKEISNHNSPYYNIFGLTIVHNTHHSAWMFYSYMIMKAIVLYWWYIV